jgi:hypothetical protein
MSARPIAYNVLELCLVRFETFSYRNITDKDTMFVAICKAKIIVPAKRPLLQMLCCPPALGKGAVMFSAPYLVYTQVRVRRTKRLCVYAVSWLPDV